LTGAHAITAVYGATNNFSGSTSPSGTQTVNKANTSAILASSLNPSSAGTAVTFTAAVNAVLPGAGRPTGTITFTACRSHPHQGASDQALCRRKVVLGTVPVDKFGQATLVTSSHTVGMHSITAAYNGDPNFIISTSTPLSQIIYAYPAARQRDDDSSVAGGTFVIGDLSAAVGNEVTFWGAHWAKSNSLSSGGATSAFKGFVDSTSPQPPRAGGVWTARPGNSSARPTSVPSYMAVIVSSSITESGSKISGNIARMVVVQTAPGYEPNPGHSGTGTVVAVIAP
jgi:hypothetical protein